MTAILGISAFYHDSAAALVVDGEVIAAAQEERFTRRKHDAGFPLNAINYCLQAGGLKVEDLDYVAFYEKPFAKFDRLLETYLAFAPAGFSSFRQAMPVWLKEKLHIRRTLRKWIGKTGRAKLIFADHHESHAASAFFPSPYFFAAILTLDGVGEWSTVTSGVGEGNEIHLQQHLQFPHSLGLLYSAFTYYCGFKVNSGEYKLMGLAPYGRPVYANAILKKLIDLKPDGSFRLNQDYFNYCQGLTMTAPKFHQLFGGPPRSPEARLEQRHMDIAASIQQVTDEIVLSLAREVHRQTRMKNLVLAGGVALNCVSNGRLLREGPFEHVWIQPAAGDAGGALGVALFTWFQLLKKPRAARERDIQKGSLLGPSYSSDDVAQALGEASVPAERFDSEEKLLDTVAGLVAEGKVVGWFQGRMEFGPRALGARCILGDARNPEMQSVLNLKIKNRESFRPFAPSVLQERAQEYFELRAGEESPYMLVVAPVSERQRHPLSENQRQTMADDPDLCARVKVNRSTIPAVTHVDYSARVQTLDEERHGRFYRLVKAFASKTGCPVIINTSFNVRGEPIVCSPQDALRCFLATGMDALVLEEFVVRKENVGTPMSAEEREKFLSRFEPD